MYDINVLSLFDGISCGHLALDRADISVEKYYASEIEKNAIKVSTNNYPDIIRLGDVTNWKSWNIDWASIDLIIAGSPCQGFSFAGKQLAFDDPRSKLFFVFVDLLNHIKKHNPNIKFLLENVKMKKEFIQVINGLLGVDPVLINSSLVSAQNRERLYWANWNITQPEDKGIIIKDIIIDDLDFIRQLPQGKNRGVIFKNKSPTITSNSFENNNFICSKGWHEWFNKNKDFQQTKKYSQVCNNKNKAITLTARMYASWNGNFIEIPKGLILAGIADDIKGHDCNRRVYRKNGKSPYLTASSGVNHEPKIAVDDIAYRKLTPIECERLQTLPDNYTIGISNSQRYKCLGNGWTVDVIAHIFKCLKDQKKPFINSYSEQFKLAI